MRVHKSTFAYKLALQERPKGADLDVLLYKQFEITQQNHKRDTVLKTLLKTMTMKKGSLSRNLYRSNAFASGEYRFNCFKYWKENFIDNIAE